MLDAPQKGCTVAGVRRNVTMRLSNRMPQERKEMENDIQADLTPILESSLLSLRLAGEPRYTYLHVH